MEKKEGHKVIWLINQYAMPPEYEPRLRTIKFAENLISQGYNVLIFSSSYLHNLNINLIRSHENYSIRNYGNLCFVHIRCPSYKKYLDRIVSSIRFFMVFRKEYRKFPKPDVIIHSATIPFGLGLKLLCKKLDAKYIVEIQDLWPETFHLLGIIKKSNPILPILYQIEKRVYRNADRLIFSMEGGSDYISEKGWFCEDGGTIEKEKVFYINNGVDIDEFDRNLANFKYDDKDLENESLFRVLYIGSIRLFNNLKFLLDAADYLKTEKDIVFIIFGDGNERAYLEQYAQSKGLNNVLFKAKRVEKEYIPYIISKSSLNVLNYHQSELWKYGGSQSKLFQYLASGKPIISNLNQKYSPILKFECGVSRQFNDSYEYAQAILSIRNLDTVKYNQLCTNSRFGAQEFDYKKLTKKLIDIIQGIYECELS